MRRLWVAVLLGMFVMLGGSYNGFATNGDNMISCGGASRSMGGVGIAYPMDVISAVFSNPAAICTAHCFESYAFESSTTFFMPHTKASLYIQGEINSKENSDSDFFAIPALGFAWKLGERSRAGIGVFGVSGMGVDYRGSSIDARYSSVPSMVYASGIYTELKSMKIAPNIAWMLTDSLSFGVALHLGYSSLDMNAGTSDDVGLGYQFGLIYRKDPISVGFTYMSPLKARYKTITDFDGDGDFDSMDLESPEMFGLGLAYHEDRWVVETALRYYSWGSADGYSDFGWRDQLVYAIGFQYTISPSLSLRFGYNHGKTPLRTYDGFNGSTMVSVQGKNMYKYYYETFRIFGFPAISEDHFTVGFMYRPSDSFSIGLGFMFSPEESIEESGTDALGNPVTIKSSMYQTSVELTLQWKF